MRLNGRRTSSNVDDRRGIGGRTAGVGLGGILIVGLIAWITGGNPLTAIIGQLAGGAVQMAGGHELTEAENQLATFSSQILAGTEDVWTAEFKKAGRTYQPPRMVLFTQAVQSGCGSATSQTGPFYCSADQTVYIDLSFFAEMQDQIGAGGDFAYAYVIAHEVGHHVQYLLGVLDEVHRQQQRMSKTESNRLNVRLELQADFYAGIWAYHDNQMYNSLEAGDIEEGLNAATAIGDDRLQMQSQGYTVPDAFNHGTSAQRTRWLKKGATTGNLAYADTFSPDYSQL